MPEEMLRTKARLLLERRARDEGIAWYIRKAWKWKILVAFCYVLLFIASLLMDNYVLASALAGFYLGQTIRELQWWRALSREWGSSMELLNWQKIESLASELPSRI